MNNKPTYEELAEIVLELGSEQFDWYAPDNTVVNKVYELTERLEEEE